MTSKRRFDRSSPDVARFIVKQLIPQPKARRFALHILREALLLAQATDAASWGATLLPNRIRLNVNRGEVWALTPGAVEFFALGQPAPTSAQVEAGARRSLPEAVRVTLRAEELEREWALWKPHFEAALARGASEFAGQNFQRPAWRSGHSAGLIALLCEEFGDAPTPAYAEEAPPSEAAAQPLTPTSKRKAGALETLKVGIARAGLSLDDAHLAAFFTALQTKGFVVLSGPSGTGKSRLALEFAALLPLGATPAGARLLSPSRAALSGGRLPLPSALADEITRLTRPFRAGEKREIALDCDGAALPASMGREGASLVVRVKGAARACLESSFAVGPLEGGIELDEGRLSLHLLPITVARGEANHLFLSVRADWRDSSALLGHFNPILNRYAWTPLLRFLLRAQTAWQTGAHTPFFVILDEMNLARTEAYFADFLSVLEAGRDAAGASREPIRLACDPRATGELPPAELFLPPNLFFIGTLNDDETAHPLAPKVLDRAWPLESPPVDFESYAPDKAGGALTSDGVPELLEELLARDGHFSGFDKALVADELRREPRWRADLVALHAVLSEWERAFGFRAFDEIIAFIALSRDNGMWPGPREAFDCAVAAKITPRLRGSGAGVEGALSALETWATERTLPRTALAAQRKRRHLEREGWV